MNNKPYMYVFLGFLFAFLGNSFTLVVNSLPFQQTVVELKTFLQHIIMGDGQAVNELSFHLILDLIIPGIIYFLATVCMIKACKHIYDQLETDKLEESFARIAILTLLAIVAAVVLFRGGAVLLIVALFIVLFINIFYFCKQVLTKGISKTT